MKPCFRGPSRKCRISYLGVCCSGTVKTGVGAYSVIQKKERLRKRFKKYKAGREQYIYIPLTYRKGLGSSEIHRNKYPEKLVGFIDVNHTRD